jgi:hypothetical protein
MKRLTRLGALLVLVALPGCAPRSIGHVLADPAEYSGRSVEVEGQVVESYSILGRGAYKVQDDTGALWIVSQTGVPRDGANVSVEGRIQDAFDVGGLVALPNPLESGVVMIESSHELR